MNDKRNARSRMHMQIKCSEMCCAIETNGSLVCRLHMKVSAMAPRYSCIVVISSIRPVTGLVFFQDSWTEGRKSSCTLLLMRACEFFSGHFQKPRPYLRKLVFALLSTGKPTTSYCLLATDALHRSISRLLGVFELPILLTIL